MLYVVLEHMQQIYPLLQLANLQFIWLQLRHLHWLVISLMGLKQQEVLQRVRVCIRKIIVSEADFIRIKYKLTSKSTFIT